MARDIAFKRHYFGCRALIRALNSLKMDSADKAE